MSLSAVARAAKKAAFADAIEAACEKLWNDTTAEDRWSELGPVEKETFRRMLTSVYRDLKAKDPYQ